MLLYMGFYNIIKLDQLFLSVSTEGIG